MALSATPRVLLIALLAAPALFPQRPSFDAASFEVASIKPTNAVTGYIRTEPGRLTARGRTIASVILRAYSLEDYQLAHGPSVSLGERYDIDAKAEGPAGSELLNRMLQTLLAERFNLLVHYETKELPVFVLSAGKSQPKLKQPKEGETQSLHYEQAQETDGLLLELVGRRTSLPLLAAFLGTQLDRPVLNETGLKGEFDFTAELTRLSPVNSGDASARPKGTRLAPSSVIDAIQSDLGLTLKPEKRKVDVLVVDHVGTFSPN